MLSFEATMFKRVCALGLLMLAASPFYGAIPDVGPRTVARHATVLAPDNSATEDDPGSLLAPPRKEEGQLRVVLPAALTSARINVAPSLEWVARTMPPSTAAPPCGPPPFFALRI
jgi:hypothetical protein